MTSTAIAPSTPTMQLSATPRQKVALAPQTYEQAIHFAEMLARSDLAPKDFRGKPENCFIAMQWGSTLGLDPMAAVQGIAVINGRPALWGDAMLAIVLGSPVCDYVREEVQGDTAICRVKRKGKGEIEHVRTFSIEDARTANLLGKTGPWQQYPKRMLQMRARGFALRDVFTDVLRGIDSAEELRDRQLTEADEPVANTITAAQQPAPSLPPAAQVASAPSPASEAAQGFYAQERFDENFEKWADLILSGKKTAEQLVSFVESKGVQLTQEQKARLAGVSADAQPAAPAPTQSNQGEGAVDGSEELFE